MVITKYKIDGLRKRTKAKKSKLLPSLSLPAKLLIGLIILAAVLGLSPDSCAFELPNHDPWYYNSLENGYVFWIPDKVQHFYGSMFLVETGQRLGITDESLITPLLAFTAGFVYEVWQESQGVGFSQRDLVADALGVASTQLSSRDVKFWMDYSMTEKTLMFRVRKLIG